MVCLNQYIHRICLFIHLHYALLNLIIQMLNSSKYPVIDYLDTTSFIWIHLYILCSFSHPVNHLSLPSNAMTQRCVRQLCALQCLRTQSQVHKEMYVLWKILTVLSQSLWDELRHQQARPDHQKSAADLSALVSEREIMITTL